MIISVLLINTLSSFADLKEAFILNNKIVLNDLTYNNKSSRYPMLKYRDVIYLPLDSDTRKVLGLSFAIGKNEKIDQKKDILFIGWSGKTNSVPKVQKNKIKFGTKCSIQIPDVYFYMNDSSHLHVNASEKYPLLTYQGQYYLPLTYDIFSRGFDWKLKSVKSEIALKSLNAVRPVIDPSTVFNTSIGSGMNGKVYILGSGEYAVSPVSTMNMQYLFSYKNGTGKLVELDLSEALRGGDCYFGLVKDKDGNERQDLSSWMKVQKGLASIPYVKYYEEQGKVVYDNFIITIDFNLKKVISNEKMTL